MIFGIICHKINKKVTTLGTLDINIPIIELGKGKPIVTITCGVHGDETTSLFVIKRLLERLPKLKGTIRIITSVNQRAQMLRQRTAEDNIDINRIFPGGDKSPTHFVAAALLKLIKDSDTVIDIHTFDLETPVLGILVDNGSKTVRKSLEILKEFAPKQAWVIKVKSKEERKFDGSLGSALHNLNIPNIAVELNSEELFSEEEVEHATNGILRVCNKLGLLDICLQKTEFPLFNRKPTLAKTSGIFIPLKKLFDKIKKGDVIGIVTSIENFSETEVISHTPGILMQMSRKKLVLPGDELAAIGRRVIKWKK